MASDTIIRDGGGSGRAMTVSSFFRGNVSAKTNPRLFYASRDEGKSFNAISISTSTNAGEFPFYLKNTSVTDNLYVYRIEFHSSEAVKWLVWSVDGTAGGTELTPANLNLGNGRISETSNYGDGAVTGLSTIARLGSHRSEAGGESEMIFFDSLIIAPGKAIAIEYDAGTTGDCEFDVLYHFETIGQK